MRKNKNRLHLAKLCTNCNIILDKTNSNEYDTKTGRYLCKICSPKRSALRYENNKIEIRAKQKIYEYNIKLKIIENYGGKCVCCGESIAEFLTIDHINGNGADERKQTKQGTGGKLYRWLLKNNCPKDNYQLLCYNCNCTKGFFGKCPHVKQ